ncbi:MAG: thiol:disulfide interchange protein, partial [Bacteroides sp.]|nr:thiol:disulfide interchange protein [Bacteroides sp.]
MKKIVSFLMLSFIAIATFAQFQEPVTWNVKFEKLSDTEAEISFVGQIERGWHVYSTDLGDGGPISATFNVDKITGAKADGALKPVGKEVSAFDKLFSMQVRYFEKRAQFVQKLTLEGGPYEVTGYLEYGACNDENCLPPTPVEFSFNGQTEAVATSVAEAPQAPQEAVEETQTATVEAPFADNLWTPVIDKLQSFGTTEVPTDISLWAIFIAGFLGGFVALFTPCVWPIIPMTVSFFLKRNKNDKAKGIRDAWTYGASIVVIYVALGLAITLLFGASALNALSTNAVFNLLFCLLLVIFAASFFGAFEITLPSKWSNAVDSKAEATTGLLSIFLMAFTLALVSFSCTGPIIG